MAHCDFFPQIMGIEQKNYKKKKNRVGGVQQ